VSLLNVSVDLYPELFLSSGQALVEIHVVIFRGLAHNAGSEGDELLVPRVEMTGNLRFSLYHIARTQNHNNILRGTLALQLDDCHRQLSLAWYHRSRTGPRGGHSKPGKTFIRQSSP
jgi:hypothetical protein